MRRNAVLLQDLSQGTLKRGISGPTKINPQVHLMPVFSHLPTELECEIFLITATEHARPHHYLLIACRVLAW